MRTTLDLDPVVLRELKARGARERRSIGAVASDLLAAALKEAQSGREPFRWSTVNAGTPLVDIDDKDALWRALDER
ncbi:MAG: hypothetical protein QM679_09150 [Patulibacter sp.]